MTTPLTITAVVLAGGQATRMSGVDKGLIELDGKPLAGHVIDTLSQQVDRIIVSANRNHADYRALGVETVSDSIEDFPGPLAGMAAAMQCVESDLLFVCPCDSPFLSGDIVARLRESLLENDADVAVAHDGERPQPVFALLRCDLLANLLKFLDDGERKIMFWYRQQKLVNVDFSGQTEIFININTPEERDAAESRINGIGER